MVIIVCGWILPVFSSQISIIKAQTLLTFRQVLNIEPMILSSNETMPMIYFHIRQWRFNLKDCIVYLRIIPLIYVIATFYLVLKSEWVRDEFILESNLIAEQGSLLGRKTLADSECWRRGLRPDHTGAFVSRHSLGSDPDQSEASVQITWLFETNQKPWELLPGTLLSLKICKFKQHYPHQHVYLRFLDAAKSTQCYEYHHLSNRYAQALI